MNKYRLCEKFTGLLMIGIFLISFCLPGFAEASNENYSMNTVFEEYGDVSLNDIIYQENFEDGDITVSDPGLVNGMTWTFHGSVETGSVKSYDSKMIRLNAGAYVLYCLRRLMVYGYRCREKAGKAPRKGKGSLRLE
jgi:hypothetical protein